MTFSFIIGLLTSPLAIAITAGVICSIAIGVGCYYLGRYQHDAETKTQARLKEELRTKEQAVRQSASQLARQTAINARELATQSQQHQPAITANTLALNTQLLHVETATEQLTQTSLELNHASQHAQKTIGDVTTELTVLREQLTTLNQELTTTRDSLAEKEAALHLVVTSLDRTQQSLQTNTAQSRHEVNTLTQELNEIIHLRTDNQRMASTIQRLETTLNQFRAEFQHLSALHQQQLTEINALHRENRTLSETINALSDALEGKNDSTRATSNLQARGLRLFN